MVKLTRYKILIIIGTFIVLFAVCYVFLNIPYFYKQINFYFYPPKIDTVQNTNSATIGEPNQLTIPSLGVKAPIIEPEQNNESSYQKALMQGVVHYPGTAGVGQVGNMYVFGHSSDFAFKGGNYKTVFALLPSIKNGAEITLSDQSGHQFTYVVVNQFVAKSTDLSVLNQDTSGAKQLTLQTSYPVGTALKRYIVIARLKE